MAALITMIPDGFSDVVGKDEVAKNFRFLLCVP
jgi:hypothetical protein